MPEEVANSGRGGDPSLGGGMPEKSPGQIHKDALGHPGAGIEAAPVKAAIEKGFLP